MKFARKINKVRHDTIQSAKTTKSYWRHTTCSVTNKLLH
jgi:hypothetical protein